MVKRKKKSAANVRRMPTQARALVTWNAILDAAAQVLVESGYEKCTTDRIAERAGVSVGSVYEYFPNKASVFEALTIRWTKQKWQKFVSQLDADSVDLADRIRQTIRARIAVSQINPQLDDALSSEVPLRITAPIANEAYKQMLAIGVSTLQLHEVELRAQSKELMVGIMSHAAHAVIERTAVLAPDLLESGALEDELTLMFRGYLEKRG